MQLIPSICCAFMLVLLYIECGSALKCHVCNSYAQEACESINGNSTQFLVTCPSDATACRKMEQRLTYNKVEHIRYVRQCATNEVDMKCKERSGTKGVKNFYCNCDKDGCNTGSTVTFSLSLLAVTFTSMFMYLKL
ncbi:hypothetical protein LOTGIDRAFT_228990 [Lottia gigantea]|uniref:Protein sleepless n=1 Tax=Lottia gigantea TaxID=225164 RepID=V3ZXE8_LOTGI|nr:hypothetical protein LOTGIDRAFT_228990 [Lottia gigantea]ESO89057.1 hypothetical protein LOTGIDRAFT_228990 [Lottia gigantea]